MIDKSWKTNLYAIWFAQIIAVMGFGFGIPFIPYYIQELGMEDPEKIKFVTAVLSAAPAIGMGIMAPVWGILSDRFGKKLMLLRAMVFASFIIAGMGMVTNVTQLIILRGMQGLFTGTITASSAFIATTTPKKKLSYALGFLSSSTFIGFSIGPALGGVVAESFGYRISFYIGGIVMVIGFLSVLIFAKENKEEYKEAREKEQNETEKKKYRYRIREILTFDILIMLLIMFFMRLTHSIFVPYIPLLVQGYRGTIEGSASVTGYINAFAGFMTALSGLTISRLGDRYNKLWIVRILLIFGVLLSILLYIFDSIFVFTVIYGTLMFFIGSIEPLLMSQTSQNTDKNKRGALFGVQSTVRSFGWAIAPFIGSAIAIEFSIRTIIITMPFFFGISLLIIYLYNKRKGEQDEKKKFFT